MLHKFLESLYNKVFVYIVVNRYTSEVYVEICSSKAVVKHFSETFQTQTINAQMLEFISTYIKESPYYYISLLDASKEQGALPTCEKNKYANYYDLSESKYKCHKKSWTSYTSNIDIYALEKNYHEIGIDLLFSPFSIVENFFKDKIKSQIALYILVQENSLLISVFENSALLYGEYIDMSKSIESEEITLSAGVEQEISLDDGINLDEMDIDDSIEDIDELDDLDDFADIEDLDSIDDIDEFSKANDIEELDEEIEDVEKSTQENFNEDYERFSYIKNSLGKFYADDKYESTFIETVYIGDAVGVTQELKQYLEEEMFLSVYVRHIDIIAEVAQLAKMEITG